MSGTMPQDAWPPGPGRMAGRIRAHDWAATPLGPPGGWPERLKAAAELMLASPLMSTLACGPDRVLLYNDAAARLYGRREPGTLGLPLARAFPDSYPGVAALYDRAFAGDSVAVPAQAVDVSERGGEVFEATLLPVRDSARAQVGAGGEGAGAGGAAGEVVAVLMTGFEVGARGRAEQALRESEARFRNMADHAPVMMWTTDAAGRCTYLNRLWHEFTGQTPEQALGIGWIDAIHPDDRDGTRRVFLGANARAEAFRLDYRLRRADGAYRWAIDAAAPRFGEDGTFLGHVGSVVDIDERREAELALEASEARLTFMSRVDDALRDAAGASATMDAATELLARQLGASRCAYADVDADHDRFVIRSDYSVPGLGSSAGTYSLDLFGSRAAADMRAGRTLVVRDVLDELAAGDGRETFLSIGIRAIVCCPLVKDGGLVAMMAVHQVAPRDWQEGEVGLVEAVVERCWANVERAGAEARLRASEAQFRAFAQAVPNHVWAARPDGALYWFNDQVYAYCGADSGSLDGAEWGRIVHPDDRRAAAATWAHALATGESYGTEFRIRRADGRFRWFLVRAEPVWGENGAIVDWVGTNTDIHDRRRAEDALRELNVTLEQRVLTALAERNLLADIVEGTDAQVQVIDHGFRLLAINRAAADEFERIFGVRLRAGDDLLAKLDHLPGERDATRAIWTRALAGEEFTEVAELGDPGRDRRHYEMKFNTLRDAEGRQVGAYQFVSDVTERVREQAALAELQDQLRQSQKMEAMGSLTGGVAHDFNNLLTPIIGSLDRLVARGVGSERERRLMAGALESAERAKTLVQRLLAFARRQPLQPVAVDVGALVRGMAGLIGSTLGPTIAVRLEVADDLPPAKADLNQIEMALLNLAVNARDAMPEGGQFTVSATPEEVGGRGEADGGRAPAPPGIRPGPYLRLAVADTGTGMDEATLARAVEPFFSTKGIGRGTGLGLSMVHGLAAQLGGGLAIESAPGQGTTVALWLPVSAEPVEGAEAGRTAAPPSPAARGHALLVDDEALVRMSTADMLMDLGFEVTEAGTAEEALRALRAGAAVDLLVTDQLMPGMSGDELAREARALRPGLPVLILTGYAEVNGIAPGLPRLLKPFRAAELVEQVGALLPAAPIRAD